MPNERVLVVEDTELLRRIYYDKLVQEGYRVLTAADGLEALSILRANPVDLVLLDLIMPRMGGLDVLESLKADPRTAQLPVVILTNLGEESAIDRALEFGAVDYLIKNQAKLADVAEKIRIVLDNVTCGETSMESFSVLLRDHEADADDFVTRAGLPRRFWCPACEAELALELIPTANRVGWFDAHMLCPACGREFTGAR